MMDPAATFVPPVRIRAMRIDDIPRVMQIADGLAEAPHWPVAAYQAAVSSTSEPRRIALVAEMEGTDAPDSGSVAGFVVASLVGGEAELESIAVAAGAQRRGAGGELLHHLLAALIELQVTRVNLEVRASNFPAIGLYRRHRFGQTGRRVGYYADPVEDAVLLELDLV